jgi:hypothetical protein
MNKKLKLIAEAIQQYTQDRSIIDTVPDDWWSAEDYMKANGLSRSSANRHIGALFKKNIIEKKNFRIRSGLRIYPVPHFRNLPAQKNASKTSGIRR